MSRPSSPAGKEVCHQMRICVLYEKDHSGLPAFEHVVVSFFEMLSDLRGNEWK
jgi:hypothetical protein